MLAAWAAKDGIHLGLPAVNYKTTVKEKDVLIQLTEVNLEKPEVPGFLQEPTASRLVRKPDDAVRPDGAESEG